MRVIKQAFIAAIMICATWQISAQTSSDVQAGTEKVLKDQVLYKNGVPQSNGLAGKESEKDGPRIHNVSDPRYQLYIPATNTGRAVIICPGGGYAYLAAGHEGDLAARWLNSQGITAMVLYYRMPNGHREIPLADLHQAIRVMRENAEEWRIDPAKVGVMGFSAGGHLASTGTVKYDESTRPDFSILIYPVISLSPQLAHSGSRNNLLGSSDKMGKEEYDSLITEYSADKNVTDTTPPVFIAFSDDDKTVPPQNGTAMYDALKAKNIPAELHIYPSGGHGWGFRENFKYHDEFTTSLARWLRDLK